MSLQDRILPQVRARPATDSPKPTPGQAKMVSYLSVAGRRGLCSPQTLPALWIPSPNTSQRPHTISQHLPPKPESLERSCRQPQELQAQVQHLILVLRRSGLVGGSLRLGFGSMLFVFRTVSGCSSFEVSAVPQHGMPGSAYKPRSSMFVPECWNKVRVRRQKSKGLLA